MKQQLVSMEKPKSVHCGFGLCPKKYKYLANPVLLEKIFSKLTPRVESIHKVKRPWFLEKVDTMYTTNCIGCNEEYLLLVENPLCIRCRGIF